MENQLAKYLNNEQKIQTYRFKKLLIKHNVLPNECNICKLSTWQDKILNLHLHHKDGNNQNNNLTNLQLLCPNCHSQTHNYTSKNKKQKTKSKKIIPESEFIIAIKTSYTRRQALLKLGLASYGGNYTRIDEIIKKHNLEFLQKPILTEEQEKELDNLKNKLIEDNPEIQTYFEQRRKTIEKKFENYKNVFKTRIEWPCKEELEQMLKEKSCLQLSKDLGVSDSAIRKRAKKYGIDIKTISKWSHKHSL